MHAGQASAQGLTALHVRAIKTFTQSKKRNKGYKVKGPENGQCIWLHMKAGFFPSSYSIRLTISHIDWLTDTKWMWYRNDLLRECFAVGGFLSSSKWLYFKSCVLYWAGGQSQEGDRVQTNLTNCPSCQTGASGRNQESYGRKSSQCKRHWLWVFGMACILALKS